MLTSMHAMNHEQSIRAAFAAYNRQDIPGLLAMMDNDVAWLDHDRMLRGKAKVGAYLEA